MTTQQIPFYITGGTLPRSAPSYIERPADTDLLEGLRQGQFCYILTSRQMGKSSLMVRTAARLRQEDIAVAVLDLTAIGLNLTPDQWYDGLLNLLARALDLEDEMEDFWFAHERLSPLQRWMLGLEKVVLKKIPGPVVLFVDEIDAVRSLHFSPDEFFAAIRECYNRRVEDPSFQRLSFCLLGVASPSDLIRDTRNTPFNIGCRIELTDFTLKEAAPLAQGLARAGEVLSDLSPQRLLERVLYWTGGHPYLTQRLCQAVADALITDERTPGIELVDCQCEKLFLSEGARERDDNLIFVRERLLRSEADPASLLDLYRQVLWGRPVRDDETRPLVSVLKLSGVVRPEAGLLAVRNRIYERAFDKAWIVENMPDAELRRQKTAYRRGLLRATTLLLTLAILVGGLLVTWLASLNARQEATKARKEAAQAKQTSDVQQQFEEHAVREAKQASDLARSEKAIAALSQQTEKKERTLRLQAEEAQKQAVAQRQIAQDQATEANRQRGQVLQLESLLKQRSCLDQARALRTSGQMGQRFASLDALAKAASLNPSPEMRLQMRNEAIADMSVPVDLQVEKRWPGSAKSAIIDVDLEHGRYFRDTPRGNIQIYRLTDDRLLTTLTGPGVPHWVIGHRSPDGRYLPLGYPDRTLVIFDCLRGKVFQKIPLGNTVQSESVDFSADGRWAAVGSSDGSIRLLTLPAGREIKRFHPTQAPGNLRLSPDGRRLAVGNYYGPKVEVLDLERGSEFTISMQGGTDDFAWQPDGHMLAVGCRDHNIYLIDPQTHQMALTLEGHANEPNHIAFNAEGTLLASSSWDGTLRLWDPRNGKPLLVNPVLASDFIHFSRDGRRLVAGSVSGCWIWKVAGNLEYQLLNARRSYTHRGRVAFSPDGRLLAAANAEGVQLWDVMQVHLLDRMEVGDCSAVAFSRNGKRLITSGEYQFYSWPVASDGEKGTIRIGPPQNLAAWAPAGAELFCQSQDGRILAAVHQANHVHVLTASKPGQTLLKPQDYMTFIAISPDGRWIATSPWQGSSQVKIWDARAGKLAQERPAPFFTELAFSPDGRWLVGGSDAYRFWEVGTWRPGPTIPRSPGSATPAPLDFTCDGRLMAIAASGTLVRLVGTATRREIASLEAPDATVVLGLRFSPDGSKLAVVWNDGRIGLWDLRRVRQRLTQLGLNWDLPPYATEGQERNTDPLRLEVIAGDAAAQQVRNQIATATAQLSAHPDDAENLNNLAWLYVSAPEGVRDAARALPLIQKAIRLKPGEPVMLNTLGIAYYRLGQYAQALGPLNESLKAGSGGGDAYNLFFLAMTYAKLGESSKARDSYDQAVRWVDAHPKIPSDWKTELQAFQAEAQAILIQH